MRIKQRVRAVGVRSELIRVLPPSQRGILVADAVASLWIAGGTSFGVRQLKPMSSKWAGALRGSVAKRYGKRSRVAEHFFGPGVHRTFPPAEYIYTFCLQFTRLVSMGRLDVLFDLRMCGRIVRSAWVASMDWWRPAVQLPSTGVPRVNSRQEVQRSISPQLKVIRVCHLKLESSYMPRVKGQAGCRICDLFCASLSLVSWHWSAREITARFLEEWLMIRCGVMRCTVSCIASHSLLCSALDSGRRWDCFLHVWQKMVSARDARRLQKTSCTACGTARRTSNHRALVVYGLQVSPRFTAIAPSLYRRILGMLCTTFCGSPPRCSWLCFSRTCSFLAGELFAVVFRVPARVLAKLPCSSRRHWGILGCVHRRFPSLVILQCSEIRLIVLKIKLDLV